MIASSPRDFLEASIAKRLGPRLGEPCTARTRRCEFWTWGSGYERPPCCTRHLAHLTRFTHNLLDRHGIGHWLDYGSLLGAARNGRLIAWDSDVDLGIRAEDLAAVLALAPEVKAAGHRLDASDPYVVRINLSDVNRQHVDIFPWRESDGHLTLNYYDGADWPGMAGQGSFPVEYVRRLEPITFEGCEIPAPSPVGPFLAKYRYGPQYLTSLRPVQDMAKCPAISPEEMTPGLVELLRTTVQKESELLALERGRLGRLASGSTWRRWCQAAMPAEAAPRHIARLGAEWNRRDLGDSGEALLEWLAILSQAIDELNAPTLQARTSRAVRRGRRLLSRAGETLRRDSRLRSVRRE